MNTHTRRTSGGAPSNMHMTGSRGFESTHGAGGAMSGTAGSQNTANLKGKLTSLEEAMIALAAELNYHKNEVKILKSEKDTVNSVLVAKTNEVQKGLTNELFRVEEEMKRHCSFQKSENSRLQQQVTTLKGEKTALEQQLLTLQRRVNEVEMQIGEDDS